MICLTCRFETSIQHVFRREMVLVLIVPHLDCDEKVHATRREEFESHNGPGVYRPPALYIQWSTVF
jgi:hypothetical protein